jgi:hypothetical protein
MSDEYYAQRARRRGRLYFALAGVAALILLAFLGIRALRYDACTRSYDRSPRSIVGVYANALVQGNLPAAQNCWERNAYYQLDAGCSEICLSRIAAGLFQVTGVALDTPYTTAQGRANLKATVSVTCAQEGATYTGEIVLDSVASNLPWRHWTIVHSTFGGTIAGAWCK